MKFAEIYRNIQIAFKEAMTALWCSDCASEIQTRYAEDLKSLMNEMITPKNAIPLVQCMEKYKSSNINQQQINKLVGDLWAGRSFLPYEHQYQSWKSLTETTNDGKVKSIVVTTGTGSGKTECFMLPLVQDIIKRGCPNGIQAIFLYPLNALMEDQKERLQELLTGTNIHFAVYNGNLPERNVDNDDEHQLEYQQIQSEREKYPNIYATRQEMRGKNKPQIILTNPTMLEYMLLRESDQRLIETADLRWVVLDEAHTYTGAGAAELSMLLRRTMLAFGKSTKDVRFATTSATLGNGELENTNNQLKRFIADLAGQQLEQIDVINGELELDRNLKLPTHINDCRKKLLQYEYVKLDELICNGNSIQEKLDILDSYCEQGLKVKVHFFNKVQSNGLKVKVSDWNEGKFRIYLNTPIEQDEHDEPYLDLVRCSECGAYMAIGQTGDTDDYFKSLTIADRDIFDFDSSDEVKNNKLVFSICDYQNENIEGNIAVNIEGNTWKSIPFKDNQWNLVCNTQCICPHCGIKLHKLNNTEDIGDVSDVSFSDKKIKEFRISPDYESQIIAPILLNSLRENRNNPDELPHKGQQYLSFVDSRQKASRTTLKQNIEEEKLWVYETVFEELQKLNNVDVSQLQTEMERAIKSQNFEYAAELRDKIVDCQNHVTYLSWKDIHTLLMKSVECERFCQIYKSQLWKSDLDTLNEDQRREISNKRDEYKFDYVHAVMIELLGRHPKRALSPETMGLFRTYYPALENIIELPQSVCEFNAAVGIKENQFTLEDWKNYLKLILDFTIRGNMSVFLNDTWHNTIHNIVDNFQRFNTIKEKRRPYKIPQIGIGKQSSSILLLAALLGDQSTKGIQEHEQIIKNVIQEVADTLVNLNLLKHEHDNQNHEGDEYTNLRLDLKQVGFKLYDTGAFVDTNRVDRGGAIYRPLDTLCKGYSLYQKNGRVFKIKDQEKFDWSDKFPYIGGIDPTINQRISWDKMEDWLKCHYTGLYDYNILGEDGCFTPWIKKIYTHSDIYVQAEHTAQVDKYISKKYQQDFKDGKINILACSTTMEMGVDLGNLELVLLNSVPSHPANYKQRAGRSGRGSDITTSACITLCSGDSIGMRVLQNPMKNIIQRVTAIPQVDLQSRQVVQRHINSFLLRRSGLFAVEGLIQTVSDFFTQYTIDDYGIIKSEDNQEMYPNDGLGKEENSRYTKFKQWLVDCRKDYIQDVEGLLKGTYYNGNTDLVCDNVEVEITRCHDELQDRIKDISISFKAAYDYINANTNFHTDVDIKNYIKNIGKKHNNKGGYARACIFSYNELLKQGLLNYLSTHRFTPNANMPINIVEFNINTNPLSFSNIHSNPSYTLQEALSQYAPDNTIVCNNHVYKVRGVTYSRYGDQAKAFKRVYTNGKKVTINRPLDNLNIWDKINGKDYLELVQPMAFIPDLNEPVTRTIEKSTYSRVEAMLINTTEWETNEDGMLFDIRTSDDSGESSILYYNVGLGYGYALCTKCHKMVPEKGCAISSYKRRPMLLPESMNNKSYNKGLENNASEGILYHDKINKKRTRNADLFNTTYFCSDTISQQKFETIKRNVILGDTIQTDYSELRLRKIVDGVVRNMNKDNDKKLILTLGIAFSRMLIETLGVESRDISFTILPTGHLCIYDTNPGGSGYSNRLANVEILKIVQDKVYHFISEIKTKDELLDKYTIRYQDRIDIKSAKRWVESNHKYIKSLPNNVSQFFPNAHYARSIDVVNNNEYSHCMLFVNSDWNKWCYNQGNISSASWNNRIGHIKSSKPTLCILCSEDEFEKAPIPIKLMLLQMQDWLGEIKVCSKSILPKGCFPIAKIGDILYFTTEKQSTNLNYEWADNKLYSVQISQNINITNRDLVSVKVHLDYNMAEKIILDSQDYNELHIKTNEIPILIYNKSKRLISEFNDYIRLNEGLILDISYQDEHLKSCLGIVSVFQFIRYFVDKFNIKQYTLKFLLEDYNLDVDNYYQSFSNNLEEEDRTRFLENMIDVLEDIDNRFQGKEYYDEMIFIKNKKELPHWRVLIFRYGEKELKIFPNGGIINEWKFDSQINKNINGKYYDYNSVMINDEIPIVRQNKIMYDIELSNLNI